ncbi:MAG: hypothetical protein ACK5VE_03780 [Alphaproteobacteria bacterium]
MLAHMGPVTDASGVEGRGDQSAVMRDAPDEAKQQGGVLQRHVARPLEQIDNGGVHADRCGKAQQVIHRRYSFGSVVQGFQQPLRDVQGQQIEAHGGRVALADGGHPLRDVAR